jgi:hypothetical protein
VTRRIAIIAVLAVLAAPAVASAKYLGSDPFVTGQGSADHRPLPGDYDISRYYLDAYVDTGITHLDQIPNAWRQSTAQTVWDFISNAESVALDFVASAFTLDFLTGPHGALVAFSASTKSLYTGLVSQGWLDAMVGISAIVGLIIYRRRPHEAIGGYAGAIMCVAVALLLINNMQGTTGAATRFVSDASASFLSGFGAVGNGQTAQQRIQRGLRRTFIRKPWLVLEFGGVHHCVDMHHLRSDGFPSGDISPNDPNVTDCIDNEKYADRFLKWAPLSAERGKEYDALKRGEVPAGDKQFPASYRLSKADSPAADMMQGDGALPRTRATLLVAVGALPMALLFALLAIIALLSSMLILAFLFTMAIGAVVGIIPGPGVGVFKWSAEGLAASIAVKLVLALLILMVSQLSNALWDATGTIGFVKAFTLQAAMMWFLLLFGPLMYRSLRKKVGAAGSHSVVGGASAMAAGAAAEVALHPGRTLRKHASKFPGRNRGDHPGPEVQADSALVGDPGAPPVMSDAMNGTPTRRRRRGPVPMASWQQMNGNGNGNGHAVTREEELRSLLGDLRGRDTPSPPPRAGDASSPPAPELPGMTRANTDRPKVTDPPPPPPPAQPPAGRMTGPEARTAREGLPRTPRPPSPPPMTPDSTRAPVSRPVPPPVPPPADKT